MIVWSLGKELKRVRNGKRVKLDCQGCNRRAEFFECIVDDTFKVFFVVELFKDTKRVMQCAECLAVCDYYQVYPEDRQLHEAAAEQARKDEETKRQAEELRRKEAAERERVKQEAEAHARRTQEQQRKEKAVDDELEALKKRLGK